MIVFLTEEEHRGTNGVHGKNGDKFDRYLKRIAQNKNQRLCMPSIIYKDELLEAWKQ